VTGPRSFNNIMCKRVLNLLETGYPRLREDVVKRIRLIEFGVNDGDGNGASCCGIEVRTNMTIAIFGEGRNLMQNSI